MRNRKRKIENAVEFIMRFILGVCLILVGLMLVFYGNNPLGKMIGCGLAVGGVGEILGAFDII